MEAKVEIKDTKPVVVKRRHNAFERFPWQRLTLSLLGIGVIFGMWKLATLHFYSLPEYAITGYVSVTNNAFYVLGAVVVFFVTGKIFVDWKNSTVSEVVQHAEHIFEKKEEKIENVYVEGENGPAVKPFSQNAT